MPTRANPAATLFPLLLAGLLAGMSYWLELASRPPGMANDGKNRHDPDYIIDHFVVRRFDPGGTLQHTAVAEQMRHYPDDDSTVVVEPNLTYHRTPPTRIRARLAHIDKDGKHVELIDDVRLVRDPVGGKPETVLTTQRLHVWPDDETARSAAPVTITQGRSRVDGSQLDVDNRSQVYVLEGPVRGVFFRDSRQTATPPAPIPPAMAPDRPPKKSPAPAKPPAGKKSAVKALPNPKTSR